MNSLPGIGCRSREEVPVDAARVHLRDAAVLAEKPVTSVPHQRSPPSSSAYVVGVRFGGSGHGVRASRPLGSSSW